MKTPDTVEIVKRFYEALAFLIASKAIRGKKTFTDRYGINRWNFNTIQKQPDNGMFQVAWLGYLVKDFGVSAEWLLTGRGGMLQTGKKP
ncbi:MAG: hypothetical protein LBU80_04890 [Rikenellaceae bacterium]|jgi:hypothetical protein|nr:hypothetical protein [Rikenellaceae bacterium]